MKFQREIVADLQNEKKEWEAERKTVKAFVTNKRLQTLFVHRFYKFIKRIFIFAVQTQLLLQR